jgi:hypothetical protein
VVVGTQFLELWLHEFGEIETHHEVAGRRKSESYAVSIVNDSEHGEEQNDNDNDENSI